MYCSQELVYCKCIPYLKARIIYSLQKGKCFPLKHQKEKKWFASKEKSYVNREIITWDKALEVKWKKLDKLVPIVLDLHHILHPLQMQILETF